MGSWGHSSSRPCPRLSFSILFSGDHGKGRHHPRKESGAQASALGGPAVSCPAAQLCVRPPHPRASLHQTGRPTFLSPGRPTLPSNCLRGADSRGRPAQRPWVPHVASTRARWGPSHLPKEVLPLLQRVCVPYTYESRIDLISSRGYLRGPGQVTDERTWGQGCGHSPRYWRVRKDPPLRGFGVPVQTQKLNLTAMAKTLSGTWDRQGPPSRAQPLHRPR